MQSSGGSIYGGKHLEGEEFDDTFKAEVERRVKEIAEERDLQGTEDTQYLNRNITMEETEAALQNIRKEKAPGCDLIYTDLLVAAGDDLKKAIHEVFHKSWQ